MQKSSTLKSIIYNTSNHCDIIPFLILDEKFILPYIAHTYTYAAGFFGVLSPILCFSKIILIHISAGYLLISSFKHLKDKRNISIMSSDFLKFSCLLLFESVTLVQNGNTERTCCCCHRYAFKKIRVTHWITDLIKGVAERANILLTWTEARGRSSFFRNHLSPIKLRVVIRFYPQSIPLTACEDQATSWNEDCIRDICCVNGLLRHNSCWDVSLSPRWFVCICWSCI